MFPQGKMESSPLKSKEVSRSLSLCFPSAHQRVTGRSDSCIRASQAPKPVSPQLSALSPVGVPGTGQSSEASRCSPRRAPKSELCFWALRESFLEGYAQPQGCITRPSGKDSHRSAF